MSGKGNEGVPSGALMRRVVGWGEPPPEGDPTVVSHAWRLLNAPFCVENIYTSRVRLRGGATSISF